VQLRNDWERFEAAGMRIAVIGQGSAARSREFAAQMELPFPLLADPRREAYTAYGLQSMNMLRELRPDTLVRSLQAGRQYGGGAPGDQDARQLGGALVIDTTGTIRYAFRQQRMSDMVSNDDLLAAVPEPESRVV
jgi:peroxiredoxin